MTRKVNVWGREYSLPIKFYYYDEPIPECMTKALEAFLAAPQAVEEALPALKEYCLENNAEDIWSVSMSDRVENIFRYVLPRSVVVLDSEEEREVALFCDYRFDDEEGLALLFRDERLAEISGQSSVL